MSNGSTRKPNLLPVALLLLLFCLFSAYFVLRARAQRPVLIGQVSAPISQVTWHAGNWYWLEGAGTQGARLVRAKASVTVSIATADRIGSYAATEDKVAWTGKEGDHWTITLAAADGSGKQTLWSGAREPHGLCLAQDRIFWLEQLPPALPNGSPFPPLESTIQLVSVPTSGGAAQEIATVLEPNPEQVIGVHEGQVYISASRPGLPGVTTIYQIPLAGGSPPRRIVGETGTQCEMLARDGTLYWSVPSPESTQRDRIVCIRRMGKDGKPETLTDWLPHMGHLYETDHGIYYVDGEFMPRVWPITTREELPHPLTLPDNYVGVGVGQGELLVRPTTSSPTNFPVYRMGLP